MTTTEAVAGCVVLVIIMVAILRAFAFWETPAATDPGEPFVPAVGRVLDFFRQVVQRSRARSYLLVALVILIGIWTPLLTFAPLLGGVDRDTVKVTVILSDEVAGSGYLLRVNGGMYEPSDEKGAFVLPKQTRGEWYVLLRSPHAGDQQGETFVRDGVVPKAGPLVITLK